MYVQNAATVSTASRVGTGKDTGKGNVLIQIGSPNTGPAKPSAEMGGEVADIKFELVASRFWKKCLNENEHRDPFFIAVMMLSYVFIIF